MDGELVSDSSSTITSDQVGRKANGPAPCYSYKEAFEQQFPYYLSIGMTEAQFWDGDCELVKYYRKAEELRRERVNQELWLQGMYVYDAVSRLVPILHAFAKKGAKAEPYVKEPYPITQEHADEIRRRREKEQSDKGLRFMRQIASSNNRRYAEGK